MIASIEGVAAGGRNEPIAGMGIEDSGNAHEDAARDEGYGGDAAGRARHERGVRAGGLYLGPGLRPLHRHRHAGRDQRRPRGAARLPWRRRGPGKKPCLEVEGLETVSRCSTCPRSGSPARVSRSCPRVARCSATRPFSSSASLKERGCAIVIVDKNLRDVARLAERMVVLEKGSSPGPDSHRRCAATRNCSVAISASSSG